MTKYIEIIRLTSLGFSQRKIMASCGVAQKTVVKVQKRARELNLTWPLDESMTDTKLQKIMFSKEREYSCAATPQVRQTENRLSGNAISSHKNIQCPYRLGIVLSFTYKISI